LYSTALGQAYCGDSRDLLMKLPDCSVDLVITSPPFALLREKEYGNENQGAYVNWLSEFGSLVFKKLKDRGSFVLDLGGAYKRGVPSRSLYNFRVLIHFCDLIGFNLAEEFYWFNPSKLPSPIEWVNKRKIRAKDAVNTVWWFSKTDFPKANVSNVLVPYSERMKKLLKNPEKFYSAKKRPSGHDISNKFSIDNGGAIPSNLLQIANSNSNDRYDRFCKLLSIKRHPARFPRQLPEFFVKFLTDPGDLVLDIFSGSNTTGEVCESLGRKWLAFDNDVEYGAASACRFLSEDINENELRTVYSSILQGNSLLIGENRSQRSLFETEESPIVEREMVRY
jgi:site-specific DNA-methyltransferase (cytosine-N4-specific)